MKKFYLSVVLLHVALMLRAQVSSDYAVMVSATISTAPANITLHWPLYATATDYTIYKKSKDATSWGGSLVVLAGDAMMYSDNAVIIDSTYEYKIVRTSSGGIEAEGYLSVAIELSVIDHRGKCLLVTDSTITSTMENELYRFMKDISGDGWSVERVNVARDQTVEHVRDMINSRADADEDIQCVVLFGRVPVPYSGDLYPDGHPDHEGAWPADGIYGDIDGNYTDDTQNITVAARPENWNVPGDGKYDQTQFKSRLELEVGRIDFYNMPSFTEGEAALLKQYLDKDHAYRNGEYHIAERGLVDDNFGAFAGEAFASNGWRNFAPMFGDANINEYDYLTTMRDSAYLWSYGCGGGWFQGASGVATTSDFVIDSMQNIFTMLFGSYFGDWDATDNFLRAPLASGLTLTNCWAGRPYWQFHHMVTGENIGYSARLSQNNTSTYMSNIFPHWVHIALMGDPTLRMHMVAPVENVSCSLSTGWPVTVGIDYTPSPDPQVIGYHVYRCNTEFGKYERITNDMINYSPFVDTAPMNGKNYYMVRAVTLKETPSGSYYNMSTGITDSISAVVTGIDDIAESDFIVYPNPADKQFELISPAAFFNTNYQMYDISGKNIQSGKITATEQMIDIHLLSAGVYFIRLEGITKKIVIQ